MTVDFRLVRELAGFGIELQQLEMTARCMQSALWPPNMHRRAASLLPGGIAPETPLVPSRLAIGG